jgi:hypothetical protein
MNYSFKSQTVLSWYPPSDLPEGDVPEALLAIEEPNPNFEIHKKMKLPHASPIRRYIMSATFVFNEQQFMANGAIIPMDIIKYWTSPNVFPI